MKKIGVMGSAFCPPTLGHLSLIDQFNGSFDNIFLVPSYSHAFGKKMYPYDLRMKMANAFALDINNQRGFEYAVVSDIESKIHKADNSPIFTYDLLNELQLRLGNIYEFCFIAGADNKEIWSKFYKSKEIMSNWNVLFGDEIKDIRSTKVREAIDNGTDFSHMVTPQVYSIINTVKETIKDKTWGLSPEAGKK